MIRFLANIDNEILTIIHERYGLSARYRGNNLIDIDENYRY